MDGDTALQRGINVFRHLLGLAAAAVLVLTTGQAATAAPAQEDQLQATLTAPDGTYVLGQTFPMRLTLTNTGGTTLSRIFARTDYFTNPGVHVDHTPDWAVLSDYNGPGAELQAGASRTFDLVGSFTEGGGDVRAALDIFHKIYNTEFPLAKASAPVKLAPAGSKVKVAGVLYGDRNENGALDPGESLAGATLKLSLQTEPQPLTTTTDGDGRFDFGEHTPQVTSLYAEELPGGWVPFRRELILNDGSGDLRIAAIRPFSEKLSATGKFDKDTYRAGDTAQVTYTFTNIGSTPIAGFRHGCDRVGGSPNHVTTDQWGEIDRISLNPGESRTVTVPSVVPQRSLEYGTTVLNCDFNLDDAYPAGGPEVHLIARVQTDAKADTWGHLYEDRNNNNWLDPGEGVAGISTVLVDDVDGAVVASAVTNAEGRVDYPGLPYGRYTVRVEGPWKLLDPWDKVMVGTCNYCTPDWRTRVAAA
ncbi:hypothetical protein D5S17_28615 [Pseudonocardiaceae bacterium YIM PH 21723]|nr:hypothetical protein D5S17_28615 [Pseudonocardiaceae bacterium YIM PH 21723]